MSIQLTSPFSQLAEATLRLSDTTMEKTAFDAKLADINDALLNDMNTIHEMSKGTLFEELCQMKFMKEVLFTSGLYFPLKYFTGSWNIRLQRFWALSMRICLLVTCVRMATDLSGNVGSGFTLDFLHILCLVTVVLQSVVLIPTFFTFRRKLHAPCNMIDLEHYERSKPVCLMIFLFSFSTGLIYPIAYLAGFTIRHTPLLDTIYSLVVIGEYSLSVFLAGSAMLVYVDAGVARKLVSLLADKLSNETLTLRELNLVRDEVKRRVHESQWMSNAVILVAILDIGVLVLILLLSELLITLSDDTINGTDFHPSLLWLTMFFVKEVPFLVVLMWESSKVNEASDQLVKQLAMSSWLKDTSNIDCNGDTVRELQLVQENNNKELLRHTLYINAAERKISMPLGFMRLNRKDLLIQFALWGISFAIGVAKTIIDSSLPRGLN